MPDAATRSSDSFAQRARTKIVATVGPACDSVEQLFALRVRGESMTGIGIFHDDVVIVRSQPTADAGDVVVAMVGDEATVKTLRKQRGQIILQPENPSFEPIVLGLDGVILGKVIEVRRYLE